MKLLWKKLLFSRFTLICYNKKDRYIFVPIFLYKEKRCRKIYNCTFYSALRVLLLLRIRNTILNIIINYSDQIANSFPEGSKKWNRFPPGKEKISFEMAPLVLITVIFICSRSEWYKITSAPFPILVSVFQNRPANRCLKKQYRLGHNL